MRRFSDNPNVDLSDLTRYPDGKIKDNTGSGNGTAVNERVYGDIYQFFLKLKRLAGITENQIPDNEDNGFQYIDALYSFTTKNTTLLNLTNTLTQINLPVKLGTLVNGEILMSVAGFDFVNQTTIKGTDNVVRNIIGTTPTFDTDDILFLLNSTSGTPGVEIIRMVDFDNFAQIALEKNIYSAATDADEIAAVSNKATTPASGKIIFTRRVIGAESGNYLSTAIRNGLMSKEDKSKLDNLAPIDKGWFSLNDNTVGASLPVSGDVTTALVTEAPTGAYVVRVTVANAMDGTDYFVELYLESTGTDIKVDGTMLAPVFKKVSSTVFDVCIRESANVVQSLKVHLRTINIS